MEVVRDDTDPDPQGAQGGEAAQGCPEGRGDRGACPARLAVRYQKYITQVWEGILPHISPPIVVEEMDVGYSQGSELAHVGGERLRGGTSAAVTSAVVLPCKLSGCLSRLEHMMADDRRLLCCNLVHYQP
jgi:hypothetical protein